MYGNIADVNLLVNMRLLMASVCALKNFDVLHFQVFAELSFTGSDVNEIAYVRCCCVAK